MRNRRNYYRILHVQRDAPAPVIKSCYRALMHTLEIHPDRGGDHWNAALLNEAYAVLSCERRRAEYDRTLGTPPRRGAGASGTPDPVATTSLRLTGETGGDGFCAFCGRTHGADAARCGTCDSPLSMSTEWSGEASGRRSRHRLAVDREVTIHVEWPSSRPRRGRIRDLSPGGLRLETVEPVGAHEIVKLDAEVLHAVARVAHCRPQAGSDRFTVGVEFFALRLPKTRGVFLSVSG